MKRDHIKMLVLAALFLALGLTLPFLTGQIPAIGKMLLPMHIPVLLCGLICGRRWGLAVGFITPLLRSVLFGMPMMYPAAVGMAFELATYGYVIGLLFSTAKWQCVRSLYRCLILSMIAGRLVWAVAQVVMLGLGENGFTYQAFIAGAFTTAIPGIALQLVLIPAVMLALDKTHLVPFRKSTLEQPHGAQ